MYKPAVRMDGRLYLCRAEGAGCNQENFRAIFCT